MADVAEVTDYNPGGSHSAQGEMAPESAPAWVAQGLSGGCPEWQLPYFYLDIFVRKSGG